MEDAETFQQIEKEIDAITKKSPIKTDNSHSKNVLSWVLKFNPQADLALKISALGHDIDRSFPELQLKREKFSAYEEYKKAHAKNSAIIIDRIAAKWELNDRIRAKINNLIENHEIGGAGDLRDLNDADGIAFFTDDVLDFYISSSKHSLNFRKKIYYSYKRLSKRTKKIVKGMKFRNKEIDSIIREVINEIDKED